jgi:hypothetical protein
MRYLVAGPRIHAEGYGPSLTVLLDFQEAASPQTVGAMQREVRHLFEPAGMRVEVRLATNIQAGETFDRLVLMKVKGSCTPPADPMLIDERGPGPLAFPSTNNDAVQPFGEVACDSVRRAVESTLWGGQRRESEQLFGRALGRVVAHELAHIVAGTGEHGKSGLFTPALSGAQLVADHAEFNAEDVQRLRSPR